MAGTARNERGLRHDINVTPLVDVMLVILIIFMVVAPFLVQGQPIKLPPAMHPDVLPEGKGVLVLSVSEGGQIFLGQNPLVAASLKAELDRAWALEPDRPIQLRADARLSFGEVKESLQAVQDAGFKQVALVVLHVDQRGFPVSGEARRGQNNQKKGGES
jgi:biopolymer transport protein TolR